MGFAAAARGAHRLMPDRVSITFMRQTSPGTYSSSTWRGCWRRSRGLTEAENSAGIYAEQAAAWSLPKTQGTVQPAPGDIVRLASMSAPSPYANLDGDYIIGREGVRERGALGVWECACVIPFLRSGLTEVVNFYRPNMVSGDGARQVQSGQTTLYSNVSVKIQLIQSDAIVAFDKLTMPVRAICYLPSSVVLQAHDYCIDASSRKWTITGDQNTNMLGVLQSIDLERVG